MVVLTRGLCKMYPVNLPRFVIARSKVRTSFYSVSSTRLYSRTYYLGSVRQSCSFSGHGFGEGCITAQTNRYDFREIPIRGFRICTVHFIPTRNALRNWLSRSFP